MGIFNKIFGNTMAQSHKDGKIEKSDFEKATDKLNKSLARAAATRAAHERKFGTHEEQREEWRKKERREERRRLKEASIRLKNLKSSIIKLLKKQGTKIPASDIDAHLKYKNVDEVNKICEEMYHNGKIIGRLIIDTLY